MSAMLTFSQCHSLIFEHLDDSQQHTVVGHFSGLPILHGDDVARISSYFNKGQSANNMRKINLLMSKAVLYAENGTFRILSSPTLTFDSNGQEIFISHDGESIFYPTPVSIPAKDATNNLKVCWSLIALTLMIPLLSTILWLTRPTLSDPLTIMI